MSFSPDSIDLIVMGVTAAATILGAVHLIMNSKKAPPDPVMEVKISYLAQTMEDLKTEILEIRGELKNATTGLTSEFKTLTKDFSEMRLSQNGLHVRMESLGNVIDEMPAKFARIARALGK